MLHQNSIYRDIIIIFALDINEFNNYYYDYKKQHYIWFHAG